MNNKLRIHTGGLGDVNASLKVYIANVPDFQKFIELDVVHPLKERDIEHISQACGNGWRKVFNVYAKFIYALSGSCQNNPLTNSFHWLPDVARSHLRWQDYRDQMLLQEGSNLQLSFAPPDLSNLDKEHIHIVMGRTYAKSLNIANLQWLNEEFAVSTCNNLIVCPYFDYRQLSNVKIIYLIDRVFELIIKRKNNN